jgi:hypothetical protein
MAITSTTGTSSQTSGGAEQTIGNSGAAFTTAGTYQLSLDPVALLTGGTTPDIVEVRIYKKVATTERQIGVTVSLTGVQTIAFEDFPRGSDGYIRFGLTQTQGTSRAIPWKILVY